MRQLDTQLLAYHFHRDASGTPYVHKLIPCTAVQRLRERFDLLPESMQDQGGTLLCDWGEHATPAALRLTAVTVLADAMGDFAAVQFSERLADLFRHAPHDAASFEPWQVRRFVERVKEGG